MNSNKIKTVSVGTFVGSALIAGALFGASPAAAATGDDCNVRAQGSVTCVQVAEPTVKAPQFTGRDSWGEAISKFPRAKTWLSEKWAANGGKKN